jgi:hypothetical protein
MPRDKLCLCEGTGQVLAFVDPTRRDQSIVSWSFGSHTHFDFVVAYRDDPSKEKTEPIECPSCGDICDSIDRVIVRATPEAWKRNAIRKKRK